MRIAFLADTSAPLSVEESAAWQFARAHFGRKCLRRSFDEIGRATGSLDDIQVLWWHYDSSADLPAASRRPEVLEAIHRFVKRGGSLFLSLLAAPYVTDLGIEPTRPNVIEQGTWQRVSWASDYPDIRGFASFQGHPVFDGFAGGLYTWDPVVGTPYAAAVYEDILPTAGQVVGIERLYIKLNERWRIASEYSLGKGRILTVGTYLFFREREARFRLHLERFTANAIEWLGGAHRLRVVRSTHWQFGRPEVRQVQRASSPLDASHADLPRKDAGLYFDLQLAQNEHPGQAFDLGGRRILVMGKQRGGLNEVWCHPVRILKDVKVGFRVGDGAVQSSDSLAPRVRISPESLTRTYLAGPATVEETILGDVRLPAGLIHYSVTSPVPVEIHLRGTIDLRLMWPLNEHAAGSLTYAWDSGLRAAVIANAPGDLAALIGTSLDNGRIEARFTGATDPSAQVRFELRLRPGESDHGVTVGFAGSHQGERQALRAYRSVMTDSSGVLERQVRHLQSLASKFVQIESPDPLFNHGYGWAVASTDRFVVETPGLGTSLMAGFGTTERGWNGGHAVSGRPGYAWYFGRDAVWSSFAMLGYGDHTSVRDVLAFLGRHQDPTGKILHELTSSGFCHYDSADATPLYLILMGRYLRASNDVRFVREEAERIRRALAFSRSTDTDGDGLIENTNVGHGWVEGGKLYPVHVEHYLAACWTNALQQCGFIFDALKDTKSAQRCRRDAKRAASAVRDGFWNAQTQFYNFGKYADGRFNEEKTILPTVGMAFGLTDETRSAACLKEIASSDFTTDWGTRILARNNPMFNPVGYHEGSVWPLFTGWVALAEFRMFRPLQGFQHLVSNLLLFVPFATGTIEEVLRGDTLTPAGVCSHQAWSETMSLQPLFDGLLGLDIDARARTLHLRPYLPAGWKTLRATHLRVGESKLSVSIERDRMGTTVRLTLRGKPVKLELQPLLPLGSVVTGIRIDGRLRAHSVTVRRYEEGPVISTRLSRSSTIEILHSGGVAVIPPITPLTAGQPPRGIRIIEETIDEHAYDLLIERQRALATSIRISDPEQRINGADSDGRITREGETIIMTFAESAGVEPGTVIQQRVRCLLR
jgi:glycogen debranching enzyme